MIDRFFAWLHPKLRWLPKLGGGIHWRTESGKVIYLWPFVGLAIFVTVLFIYDRWFA